MKNKSDKAYERLKELLLEADSLLFEKKIEFDEWHSHVESALYYLAGEGIEFESFQGIRFAPRPRQDKRNDIEANKKMFMEGIKQAKSLIRITIKQYEDYELGSSDSIDINEIPKNSNQNLNMKRKIFVVHGHDEAMKESVARFLERIDFDPIILHEQASAGDTIIEKFERNADVSYAVVLLSPDDVGAAKDRHDSLQPRARQNVVLELGYFIGKLGRTHVFPLVRKSVEVPSDFSGVVYVPFEGDWKMKLIQELKHLGFEIDANKAFA